MNPLAACALTFAALTLTEAAEIPNPDPAGLPPRSVPERLAPRPVPDWVRSRWRVGHLPGSPVMAEHFVKEGFGVITLNALGKWEVVGPSAPLYPPERVREAESYLRAHVERCHEAGAKAIFYIGPVQVPIGNDLFNRAHPDWLCINSDGIPEATPNFANIRSGYADWLVAQLGYVTREFKADGFWFDGYAPVHLHTYDEATRRAFREFSGGQEIPKSFHDLTNPVTRQYLAWHEDYFVKLADRLRGAIRAENPGAIIYANHSANRTWYFPNHYMGEYPLHYASAVDVPSVELYWDVPGDPLYQQFVYAFMQGLTRERGAAVWIQPSAHGISGVSSPVEIQLRALEALPWGVTPEFIESTGREEYFKTHAANLRAREEWLQHAEAISYVGLVASEQTRQLAGKAALPVYFSHTLGAFKAMTEKHLPVRVLTESDLEDGTLHDVRVLVMPNVAVLSDRAAEVVRRFVRNGGGLVASFETSLYDTNLQRRSDFALADLFRARYSGTKTVTQRSEELSLRLRSARHPITDDPLIKAKQSTGWINPGQPPPEGPLALIASAAEVEGLEGGETIVTWQPSASVGNKSAPRPALITGEFGRGRVAYFPAAVDKAFFFFPDAYQRQLLANAVRWAARDEPPPLEVEGPLILTATFHRQRAQKRVVVHLLNQASSWGQHSIYQKLAPLPEELNKQWGFPNQSELRGTWPVREEVIPLHGIRVRCRLPGVTKATLQPGGANLPLEKTSDGVRVTVPVLEMHAMVVFE